MRSAGPGAAGRRPQTAEPSGRTHIPGQEQRTGLEASTRNVVVTGGGTGIGRARAAAFAARATGSPSPAAAPRRSKRMPRRSARPGWPSTPRTRRRSRPPWTSCRRPWRSWSTMRREHRLRPDGPGRERSRQPGGRLAGQSGRQPALGRLDDRGPGPAVRARHPGRHARLHRGPPGCRVLRGGQGGRRGLDRRRRRGTGTYLGR